MASWTEKELEDWLWEHPEAIAPFYRHIGRQVRIGAGRADIVGAYIGGDEPPSLLVIELKATCAGMAALVQLCGYMEDLKEDLWQTECGSRILTAERTGYQAVEGCLAAPGFSPQVLQISAGLVGCALWTVEQQEFRIHGSPRSRRVARPQPYLHSDIEHFLRAQLEPEVADAPTSG